MKKILFVLFAALFISSCQTTGYSIVTKAQKYMQDHCPNSTITNPFTGKLEIHYECGELWNVAALSDHCTKMQMCIDLVKGNYWGDVSCDTIFNPDKLLKLARPNK